MEYVRRWYCVLLSTNNGGRPLELELNHFGRCAGAGGPPGGRRGGGSKGRNRRNGAGHAPQRFQLSRKARGYRMRFGLPILATGQLEDTANRNLHGQGVTARNREDSG